MLIGIGSLVALLSFLGCCGAWAENTCFLCLVSPDKSSSLYLVTLLKIKLYFLAYFFLEMYLHEMKSSVAKWLSNLASNHMLVSCVVISIQD